MRIGPSHRCGSWVARLSRFRVRQESLQAGQRPACRPSDLSTVLQVAGVLVASLQSQCFSHRTVYAVEWRLQPRNFLGTPPPPYTMGATGGVPPAWGGGWGRRLRPVGPPHGSWDFRPPTYSTAAGKKKAHPVEGWAAGRKRKMVRQRRRTRCEWRECVFGSRKTGRFWRRHVHPVSVRCRGQPVRPWRS